MKKKFLKSAAGILLTCFLHFSCFSLSNTKFQNEFNSMVSQSKKINQYKLKVTQEFYSALRKKINYSYGTLLLEKPNKFRFEITKPRKELYVFNGKDFWKYIEEMNLAQHFNSNLPELGYISILADLTKLTKYYTVSEWENKLTTTQQINPKENSTSQILNTIPKYAKNSIYIQLIPKENSEQKVLYAVYDKSKKIITQLTIEHSSGNQSRFIFDTDAKSQMTADTFNFKIPQGIHVSD